jgi:hypothetical protein
VESVRSAAGAVSGDEVVNTGDVADTPDTAGGIGHETPKTQTRVQRPKSRLHPSPEALDALEEVLLRFSGDLLEKYILRRWVAPDRHNRRRQRDPTLGQRP